MESSQPTKVDILREATINFLDSEQNVDDLMDFSIAIHSSLRQGSGLMWSNIHQVFDECVKNRSSQEVQGVSGSQGVQGSTCYEPDNINAKIAQFCTHNLIDSMKRLAIKIAPMIDQMSLHCAHLTFDERKPFREIKHTFLDLMYKNGMAYNVTKRISKSPLGKSKIDTLVELNIGNYVFHVPDRNQNFVNIDTLDLHEQIYVRAEKIPISGIDYTFKRHLEVLQNLESLVKFVKQEA